MSIFFSFLLISIKINCPNLFSSDFVLENTLFKSIALSVGLVELVLFVLVLLVGPVELVLFVLVLLFAPVVLVLAVLVFST